MISLENSAIKLMLNQDTGGIVSIQNKIKRLNLCRTREKTPWRLQIQDQEGSEWITECESFEYHKGVEAVVLRWKAKFDIVVEARIELPREDGNAYFYLKADNNGPKAVSALEYPIIGGIHALGADASRNCLVHPVASGYLFHDPFNLFQVKKDEEIGSGSPVGGISRSIYPDGFHGTGMQFVGYYIEGKGGFYIAAHDPHKTVKYMNFYRHVDNHELVSSFVHFAWDVRPSNSLVLDYPVVVGPLIEGSWYEAADKYREWATKQEWCQGGLLWDRVRNGEASKWLLEDVGFCTFGVSSAVDQADWYDAFHKIACKPVFHITGWDWSGPPDKNYGGRESWFPAAFNQRNVETIKKNGDYFAPFEFDLFYNRERPGWDEARKFSIVPSETQLREKGENMVKMLKSETPPPEQMKKKLQELRELLNQPKVEFPEEWRWFLSPFNPVHKDMCPVTEFWQDFHWWRDEMTVKHYGADANYYDISASISDTGLPNEIGAEIGGPTSCYSTEHSHPRGAGRWMIDAYRRLFEMTKDATSRAKGRYVPQGTEVITEVFVDKIDFYQARAEAGPCGAFEGEPFKRLEMEGKCEKIPLFTYVYHDYGPVRLDGWGKLSKDFGDIFYWIASRVTLWGGIFELNYEFSSLERFPHMKGPSGYVTYGGEWRIENYDVDPSKMVFLKEITEARTGFAKEYLAYGRMVRPLQVESPPVSLNYFYYNVAGEDPKKRERGVFTTKSIIHSAWMFKDEKLGFLFVNLQDKQLSIDVKIDPEKFGLTGNPGYTSYYVTAEERRRMPSFKRRTRKRITLPPKKIVLVEIKPL